MKKNTGYYSMLLSTSKNEKNRKSQGVIHYLSHIASVICIGFLSAFMFTSIADAQTTGSNPDITNQFKQDQKDLNHDKKMMREVREEKRQIKELNNIPETIMNKFNLNFPNAKDVAWSVPADYVQVDFTLKNKHKEAYYDYNNHLIGMSHFLSYDALPAKSRDRIAKDYKGYTPVKTMFYDDNEDNDLNMVLFGQMLPKDSYFVQLKKGSKNIVLQVDTDGEVSFFSDMQ